MHQVYRPAAQQNPHASSLIIEKISDELIPLRDATADYLKKNAFE
jgi:hypothetical protein